MDRRRLLSQCDLLQIVRRIHKVIFDMNSDCLYRSVCLLLSEFTGRFEKIPRQLTLQRCPMLASNWWLGAMIIIITYNSATPSNLSTPPKSFFQMQYCSVVSVTMCEMLQRYLCIWENWHCTGISVDENHCVAPLSCLTVNIALHWYLSQSSEHVAV